MSRTFALWTLLLVAGSRVAAEGAPPPPADIAAAGSASCARLETDAAEWTSVQDTGNGTLVRVEVFQAQGMRRFVVSVQVGADAQVALRLIERDGLWYVRDCFHETKCRPYEAVLSMPSLLVSIRRAELRFVVDAEAMAKMTCKSVVGTTATYRQPIEDGLRTQCEGYLRQIEAVGKKDPTILESAEPQKMVDRIKDLLAHGVSSQVDISTGMVVNDGVPPMGMEIKGFRWIEHPTNDAFSVDGTAWADQTDDPTAGDLGALVMFCHDRGWQVGMKASDFDGVLLDLRTGRFRRVPYHSGMCNPGCFLGDRGRVIVSGTDDEQGGFALFEVDLRTGSNRRIWPHAPTAGLTSFPVVSPDGRTLAATRMGTGGRPLEFDTLLINLESGEANVLGNPSDLVVTAWLPDGKELLAVSRDEPGDPKQPSVSWLARVDMQGKVRRLRRGSEPVLIKGGTAILYQDDESRTWWSCDLNGENAERFSDGLEHCGFPASSPDGEKFVMMYFEPGKSPVPRLYALDGHYETITTEPGFWGMPVWR